jgi:hypothetical protein
MAKAKLKKPVKLKKTYKAKPHLVNFKVTTEELKLLTAKAKKYAGGNVSFWLRHAGLHHIPKSKDLRR